MTADVCRVLLDACRAALPYVEKRGELVGGPQRRQAVVERLRHAIECGKHALAEPITRSAR